MPGTGRPWPTVALFGDRYEYGTQIFVFAVAGGAGRRWRCGSAPAHARPGEHRRAGRRRRRRRAGALLPARAPDRARHRAGHRRRCSARRPITAWRRRSAAGLWLAPTVLMLGWLLRFAAMLRAHLARGRAACRCGSSLPSPWSGRLPARQDPGRAVAALGAEARDRRLLQEPQRARRAAHRLAALLARRELLLAQRDLRRDQAAARADGVPRRSQRREDAGVLQDAQRAARLLRRRAHPLRVAAAAACRSRRARRCTIVDQSNNKLYLASPSSELRLSAPVRAFSVSTTRSVRPVACTARNIRNTTATATAKARRRRSQRPIGPRSRRAS